MRMLVCARGLILLVFLHYVSLGVHVIGEAATEIVHIGQAAIAMGAPVDYFKDTVFNFPTFAEAYQGKKKTRTHTCTRVHA